MSSDQLDAIKEAMNAAGIAPGEAVEFAGHSQGGIMAAQLAADPGVRARYNVVSVVTAGSPTATIAPSDSSRAGSSPCQSARCPGSADPSVFA